MSESQVTRSDLDAAKDIARQCVWSAASSFYGAAVEFKRDGDGAKFTENVESLDESLHEALGHYDMIVTRDLLDWIVLGVSDRPRPIIVANSPFSTAHEGARRVLVCVILAIENHTNKQGIDYADAVIADFPRVEFEAMIAEIDIEYTRAVQRLPSAPLLPPVHVETVSKLTGMNRATVYRNFNVEQGTVGREEVMAALIEKSKTPTDAEKDEAAKHKQDAAVKKVGSRELWRCTKPGCGWSGEYRGEKCPDCRGKIEIVPPRKKR